MSRRVATQFFEASVRLETAVFALTKMSNKQTPETHESEALLWAKEFITKVAQPSKEGIEIQSCQPILCGVLSTYKEPQKTLDLLVVVLRDSVLNAKKANTREKYRQGAEILHRLSGAFLNQNELVTSFMLRCMWLYGQHRTGSDTTKQVVARRPKPSRSLHAF